MSPVALRRSEQPIRAPNAREILHAMLEGAHLMGFAADGSAVLTWTVPAATFASLCAWDADEREEEGI